MVFELEAYIGDPELSLVGASTSTLNALVYMRHGAGGSFEGGLRGRIYAGGVSAGEVGGGACPEGEAHANVSPRTNGSFMNGVDPRPKDAPGRVALTPGSLKGPGFSLS
jgi:hypothetical protein